MNTLSNMCGTPVFVAPKRPAGRRDAPCGTSFPVVEAEVQYREQAPEVPIYLILGMVIAAVLLVTDSDSSAISTSRTFKGGQPHLHPFETAATVSFPARRVDRPNNQEFLTWARH
jgi:hypothetical protein